jgi:hypothetical protein
MTPDQALIYALERDKRYINLSSVELRIIRDNMFLSKDIFNSKFDKACVQYWLMKKEGRLDALLKPNS